MENTEFGSWCLRSCGGICRRPYRQGQSDASARHRNEREANRLAVRWIADFQAAITSAAAVKKNAHGYDWITRYRAYHRGQNRSPSEERLFPPHPALAIPETQDNAPMESFFGTLKTELVHQSEYPDRDTARRDLFADIEGYYNRQRR